MSAPKGQDFDPAANPDPKGPEVTPAEAEANAVFAELETLRKDAAAAHDRYLRVAADLENFRRRAVREKDELRQFAASKVLEGLLPVWDNLILALAAAKQPTADIKTLVGGVEMVLQQLRSTLSEQGLTEVNPVGKPFDPHQAEAISHQPSADVKEEHVLTVVRPGFVLNGRLLRPASVVVSSGPAKK
ncbi:MAG TPA: nucleotide exchange factor GrpE [Opitutaceae bacterium]|jgi:molecular chaperone GrpE